MSVRSARQRLDKYPLAPKDIMSPLDFIQRPKWAIKQILPLNYACHYKTESGEERFAIWRMWFGNVFGHYDVAVDPNNPPPIDDWRRA